MRLFVCLSVVASKFFLVGEVPSQPHTGWPSLCLDSQPHLDVRREGTSLSVLEAFFVSMGFWSVWNTGPRRGKFPDPCHSTAHDHSPHAPDSHRGGGPSSPARGLDKVSL